jgi:predicted NBD/HSP70 family sugar kinase
VSPVQRRQDTSVALLQRLVLANFASRAGLTRQQLEELTGLSRTVVAGVVGTLVERGELVQMRQSPVPGLRGRPPARYQRPALLAPVLLIRLVRDGSTAACLVSGDNTSGAVVDCAPWWQNWGDWSRSVAQAAKRLSDPAQLPPRAAVVSMPFPVADGHGAPSLYGGPRKILKMAGKQMPPQPHWLDFDRQRELSYLLGCTALPVNDANLAALGEARFGAGRGYRAVVHVSVVNGVGAGLVLGGQLFTGAHGFAGELAHLRITPDGYPCDCRDRGCLAAEQGALRLGIVNDAVRAPEWNQGPGEPAAGRQMPAPPDYLTGLGRLIGRALAPLLTAVDPDCLVVDAGLGESGQHFVAAVSLELGRSCPPPVATGLTVVAGELRDADRHGALALADAYATALLVAD